MLLDRFEKAKEDVQQLFLSAFQGKIEDSQMRTIDCSRSVWILTSNMGQESIMEAHKLLHTVSPKPRLARCTVTNAQRNYKQGAYTVDPSLKYLPFR